MSNKKTGIIPRPKPTLSTKTWTYVSIAGALVAIIYAGLSLQKQEDFTSEIVPSSMEAPVAEADSLMKKEEEVPVLNSLPDPSH